MGRETKSRTIKDDKWEGKIYTEQCKGNIAKDIIKIRLHRWAMKYIRKREIEEERPSCPLCEIEDDTTVHVFKCGRDTDRKQRNIKNNTEEE